ncbi:NIL domain-containing protein, partial [Kurthia senegalensis]
LQQFEVRGNFLHGTIEYIQERPLGIFIMELIGEEAHIHRAISYIESRGVSVEVQ